MPSYSANTIRLLIRLGLVLAGVAVGVFAERMISPGLTRDALAVVALIVLMAIAFALILLVGMSIRVPAYTKGAPTGTTLDAEAITSDITGIQVQSALAPTTPGTPNAIVRAARRLTQGAPAQRQLAETTTEPGTPAPETPENENLKKRPLAALLFVAGLLIAAVGQVIWSSDEHSATWGLVAVVLAYAVLFAALRLARRPAIGALDARLGSVNFSRTNYIQAALTVFAVVAVVYCTFASQSPRPENDYQITFYAWLAAIGALTVAFVLIPARDTWSNLRARLWAVRFEILIVAFLTVLGFGLRVYDLTNIPFPFGGDEGSIGQEAVRILQGEVTNMFGSGWSSEASLSFLPWAISVRLFGETIFGIRLLAAILGALTIPATYLMARAMFNKPIALLAAAILTVMALHIHFSRQVLNNVEAPLYAALSFGMIYRAVQTRKAYWFAASGIVAGLSVYSYAGSRLVLILAGAWLLIQFVLDKNRWAVWHKYLVFAVCATLVALPIAYYFGIHLDIGFSRMNQMGAFQTGWVDREIEATGEPVPWIIFRNLVRTLLMFVSIPAVAGFYNSPQPLFDGAWSFFLVVGLGLSLFSLRQGRHLLLQMWFWSVVFFGGALIIPPPAAERMVILLPAVALFIALALWKLAAILGDLLNWRPVVRAGLVAVAVVVLAYFDLSFYFWFYTPMHFFTAANDEVALDLGLYMGSAPRDTKVYFEGQPRMFIGFPSIPYLSHNLEGVDLNGANVNELDALVEKGRRAIFAVTPDHKRLIQRIRDKYPGGVYQEIWRSTKPEEMLYLRYSVIPE